MTEQDTILGVMPGSCPTARTILLMRRCAEGRSTVCLRNESFSDAVGWFPQSSVELSPEQLGQLKSLIGASPTRSTPITDNSPATLSFSAGLAS